MSHCLWLVTFLVNADGRSEQWDVSSVNRRNHENAGGPDTQAALELKIKWDNQGCEPCLMFEWKHVRVKKTLWVKESKASSKQHQFNTCMLKCRSKFWKCTSTVKCQFNATIKTVFMQFISVCVWQYQIFLHLKLKQEPVAFQISTNLYCYSHFTNAWWFLILVSICCSETSLSLSTSVLQTLHTKYNKHVIILLNIKRNFYGLKTRKTIKKIWVLIYQVSLLWQVINISAVLTVYLKHMKVMCKTPDTESIWRVIRQQFLLFSVLIQRHNVQTEISALWCQQCFIGVVCCFIKSCCSRLTLLYFLSPAADQLLLYTAMATNFAKYCKS